MSDQNLYKLVIFFMASAYLVFMSPIFQVFDFLTAYVITGITPLVFMTGLLHFRPRLGRAIMDEMIGIYIMSFESDIAYDRLCRPYEFGEYIKEYMRSQVYYLNSDEVYVTI